MSMPYPVQGLDDGGAISIPVSPGKEPGRWEGNSFGARGGADGEFHGVLA